MQLPPRSNGKDGDLNIATVTDAPVDSACAAVAASHSITGVTAGLVIVAGDLIKIHQTRGNNHGKQEYQIVDTYVGTTITTVGAIENTYVSSGDDRAQVVLVKQYKSVIISGTLTLKAWNGITGGLLSWICQGKAEINTIVGTGKGFRGSDGNTGIGDKGEGSAGDFEFDNNANNGSGGGGGSGGNGNSPFANAGGGGGGNKNAGSGGGQHNGSGTGGAGGLSVGTTDLADAGLGGGGGSGGGDATVHGGDGGNGGALIDLEADEFVITGGIQNNGNFGQNSAGNHAAGGGGGAGGSTRLRGRKATGLSLCTVNAGGAGGADSDSSNAGGNGSDGRQRFEFCEISGSTPAGASVVQGGFEFCGSSTVMM